ncbi:MAG: hypothetical protein K0S44_641 [Bacteroidetes bacterium]|jgi:uncharacterized protein YndB with AHSA1/START domain|nr:hypothetical protein [Bacteroidota bacterium]
MNNTPLQIKVGLQIESSANDVFEAIVDPAKMSNYFIGKGSARMEQGKEVIWNFAEFDLDIPVKVSKIEKDKFISFTWSDEEKRELVVEMKLTPVTDTNTLIQITESGHVNNESGIKWLAGNTEGWANFVACLKAYVEHGINLRKGAFDFRFK